MQRVNYDRQSVPLGVDRPNSVFDEFGAALGYARWVQNDCPGEL